DRQCAISVASALFENFRCSRIDCRWMITWLRACQASRLPFWHWSSVTSVEPEGEGGTTAARPSILGRIASVEESVSASTGAFCSGVTWPTAAFVCALVRRHLCRLVCCSVLFCFSALFSHRAEA